VRGYSTAAFCAVLATVVFFNLTSTPREQRSRWPLALYGALLGLAIAAHAYAGLALVAHVLWVVVRRSKGDLLGLLPAWVLAAIIAVAANGYILWVDVTQHGFLPRAFDAEFPRDLLFYLLGAPSLLAIGLWLSTAGLGLWAARLERLWWASVGIVVAAAAALWLGIQPFYLYPRFFLFVVPATAYLMAASIKRWKGLAPGAARSKDVKRLPRGGARGAVGAALTQVPNYTADPLALRAAAIEVASADAA